jgi:hypothetical protein
MAVQAIYSVSNLITRIRTIYDETDSSNSYVSDAEIVYFLNMGQLDICTRFPIAPYFSDEISGASFSTSTKEYTLTQDILVIERVHLNQREIGPIPYEPYDEARYVPTGYYARYNKLGIPCVQTTDTVKIWGRTVFDELTTSSTPAMPAVYNNALISYGLKMCKAKDQDQGGMAFWDQVYERDLANANRAHAQTQVGVRQIRKVV